MSKPAIHPSRYSVDDLIGWVGFVFVLLGYSLVSFDIISAQSVQFQGLMFLGSLGLMVIAYRRHVMQPFLLNLIFAIIAFVSLLRIVF